MEHFGTIFGFIEDEEGNILATFRINITMEVQECSSPGTDLNQASLLINNLTRHWLKKIQPIYGPTCLMNNTIVKLMIATGSKPSAVFSQPFCSKQGAKV